MTKYRDVIGEKESVLGHDKMWCFSAPGIEHFVLDRIIPKYFPNGVLMVVLVSAM